MATCGFCKPKPGEDCASWCGAKRGRRGFFKKMGALVGGAVAASVVPREVKAEAEVIPVHPPEPPPRGQCFTGVYYTLVEAEQYLGVHYPKIGPR